MRMPNLVLCARLVANNSVGLAARLMAERPFVFARLQMVGSKLGLRDELAFNVEYCNAKRGHLEDSACFSEGSSAHSQHKVQATARLALLWRANFATMSITAVTDDVGVRGMALLAS